MIGSASWRIMTWSARFQLISIAVATFALVAGLALGGLWIWTVPLIMLGALWFWVSISTGNVHGKSAPGGNTPDGSLPGRLLRVRRWSGWGLFNYFIFFLYAGTSAAGLIMKLPPLLMLLGVIFALCAWDLFQFSRRLNGVKRIEAAPQIEQDHLQKLIIVAGGGLIISGVSMFIRIRLNFILAIILGLLALLALSRAVGFLKKR